MPSSGGKHSCIEKDIEIIPREKIVPVFPQETFGISKILSDYTVETRFQKLGDSSTKVEISHYYSTPTLKARLLNLVVKGRIARETHTALTAAKAAIEAGLHADYETSCSSKPPQTRGSICFVGCRKSLATIPRLKFRDY